METTAVALSLCQTSLSLPIAPYCCIIALFCVLFVQTILHIKSVPRVRFLNLEFIVACLICLEASDVAHLCIPVNTR